VTVAFCHAMGQGSFHVHNLKGKGRRWWSAQRHVLLLDA
jgi:hypothetical protein